MFRKSIIVLLAALVSSMVWLGTAGADVSELVGRYSLMNDSRADLVRQGMPSSEIEDYDILYVLKSLGGLELEPHLTYSVIVEQDTLDNNRYFHKRRKIEARFLRSGEGEIRLEGKMGPHDLKFVKTEPVLDSPGDGVWPIKKPADLGIDAARLTEAVDLCRSNWYANIHGLVVVKDGYLILEEYFNGSDAGHVHQIRSAGKSISSIVVGLAIDRGYLKGVKETIVDFFPDYEPESGWDDEIRQVTVESLLSMTSGFDCDDWRNPRFICELELFRSPDWIQYALDRPMAHPPYQHWAYNSAALMLLGGVVSQATGMPADRFAFQSLFQPLGIETYIYRLSPNSRPFFGGLAKMRARDMAKIGCLFLKKGKWRDEKVVSEHWVEASTKAAVMSSNEKEYGYLWWRGKNIIKGRLAEEYNAAGNGGQYIFVFPKLDMVVVFTGGNYNHRLANQPMEILDRFILPAILPDTPPETVAPIETAKLEKLTGRYRNKEMMLSISLENGQLYACLTQPEHSEQGPLEPISETEFIVRAEKGPTLIEFIQGEDDRPPHIKAHRNWHCAQFEKIKALD